MKTFPWLMAMPIAHRGLHRATDGIVENSLSAAAAAVERGYTIECDVQRSADGEAVVFHDAQLGRLTDAAGAVAERTVAELTTLVLRGSADRIPVLGEFLGAIGGVVPVIVEIKSGFDGDMRLADRTAEIIARAAGAIALKSFDPEVIAYLRGHPALEARGVPRGVVAQASYTHPEWDHVTPPHKRELAQFLHFDRSRPDFISYRAFDLPHAVPYLCRTALGLPVMGWTTRSPDEAKHALAWADQIVFEGFDPSG